MNSRSLPAVISFAAPAKIQNQRGRLVAISHVSQFMCPDYIKNILMSHLDLQLEFVRKRYHKDILSSPVLMLNFCPDLLREPLELHKATRELLFLVDRSGSMSGTNIHRVKVSCRQDENIPESLD